MKLAAAIAGLATAAAGGTPYYPLNDTSARCLDGSQYGFLLCKGTTNANWTIGIQGGGWCYDEVGCLERAATPLGSSSTWAAKAATMECSPSTSNYVQLWYCDGASFSGYREETWPVPGTNSSLYFRGIRNLDASLDALFDNYGMDEAEFVILNGGSAGGLSTFLHLDHVQQRVTARSPAARVVGQPVCGFFLDHGNDGFAPANMTYPLQMQYVFNMQNSSGSLSPACQAFYGPDNAWKCIMAPHAAPFIQTPWFALQSRFDHWQLAEILFLPCMQAQPYTPPYNKSTCTPQEDAAIQSYGPDFWAQFSPLIAPGSKNGVFLDACIIHGSTNSTIDGVNNEQAFNEWLLGGRQWWIMQCNGSNSTGPCDPSPICAPFP